jgi:putative inorganic carbon (HCO3(-)) transporter
LNKTVSRSFFVQAVLLLWTYLKQAYLESGFHRLFCRLYAAVSKGVSESRIVAFLGRDGTLTKAFPQSRLYRWTAAVLDAPRRLTNWLWRNPVVRQSKAVRLCRILGRRTWVLLALLFALMLVVPHAKWNNLYGFLGIFLITVLFFLAAAGKKAKIKRLETERFSVYFVIYAVVLLLGLLFSVHFGLSLRFFLFHLTGLMAALLLVSVITTKSQLKALLAVLLVGLTICSLYGCYQRIVGVEVVASQVDYSLALNQGIPGRVYSFFDNPNNFAEILVMLVPLYLAFIAMARGWKRKCIAFVCLLPALWAILQTYSRSGWIGLCLAALIFLAFQNWRLVPACIGLLLVAIPFLPQTVINRILSIGNSNDSSTMYRFQIYDTLWPMFRDFWVSGAGLGSDTVKEVIMTYPTRLLNGAYPIHSHNTYLQLWLEAGILAPICYLGGTFYQIKQGLRGMKRCSADLKYILSAAIGGLVGVMVIALAEYTWFYPRVMFLFWLLLGILMAASKLALQEGETAEAAAVQPEMPLVPEKKQRKKNVSASGTAKTASAPLKGKQKRHPASHSTEVKKETAPEDTAVSEPQEPREHGPEETAQDMLARLTLEEKQEMVRQFYDLPGPDELETPIWALEMELGLTEEAPPDSDLQP